MKSNKSLESDLNCLIRSVAIVGLLLLTASAVQVNAQVSYTTPGSTYTQNFDDLLSPVPANNTATAASVLPLGWGFIEAGANANTTLRVDNGSSGTGDTYFYGATSSNERAFGSYASGSLTSQFGLQLVNNSGGTITSFTVTYDGEQWKDGGSASSVTNKLTFSYAFGAASLTSGTYINESSLDFTAVTNNPTTDLAKDGNLPANRTAGITKTITGVSWANGDSLWLRWTDLNETGNDDGLAVDNFSFSTTAGPNVTINSTGVPAVGNITPGSAGVPVFGFQLTPFGGTVDFTGLKLTTVGSATSSDLSNLRVVYDVNGNDAFDGGDLVVSGSAQPLANPVNFTITGQTFNGLAHRYLVVADVAGGATVGHTFTGSIVAPGDVTTTASVSGTAAGNQQTIASAPFDLTISAVSASESTTISSVVNDAAISTTGQGAQAWQVTFNNPAGNAGAATLTAINFTQGANNGVTNWANTIQAAELFDGSTALAAGVISATNIAFSGLSVVVGDNASKTLSLRISLKSTAGALKDHANFQFALAGLDVTGTGNGVTTASINSDQTLNVISVVATKLAVLGTPATVITNTLFAASVQAQDANGNLDLDDATSVTLNVATGGGILSGGTAQSLVNGTNRWSSLSYDTAGIFSVQASGGTLAAGTSANITALLFPTITDVFVPQYIQGVASGSSNTKRLPYAFRVTLGSLIPNSTYRYYNQCVVASDSATTSGAGNCIFANPSGFIRSSGPTFSSAGNYGEFTSDATGTYTGWFVSEPTGNAKFTTAGNQIFMRITLNDGNGGTGVSARVTTTAFATVLAFNTTGANTGTGIRGNSSASDKNFVLLYDNVAGTGQPLVATVAENDGLAENTAASYVSFYSTSVDGISGAWGGIVPNANANGVQRIEQRSLTDGSLVAFNTDSDGIWPSGANTVNPTGGDATPLVITATDAPLGSSAPPISYLAINSVSLSATNVIIGGTNAGAGTFYVLASTNLTLPKATWSLVATNIASGTGTFILTATNAANVAMPQRFYLLSTTNNQ